MNLSALKTELAKPEYAELISTGNHSAIVAALTAKTLPGKLPLWELKKLLCETGTWAAIKAARTTHENAQVKAAAVTVVDYVDDARFENIDLSLTGSQAMLGALVAGEVITQELATSIEALTANRASLADQMQLGDVGVAVSMALRELE